MDQPFEIRLIGPERALEIANSSNEAHDHDFEELLIGVAGEIEHFIDFRKAVYRAPFVSFVTRGKMHRLVPAAVEGQFAVWAITFVSEFIPETTFQLYAWYHDHANLQLQEGKCFNRLNALCGMMHDEMQQQTPDYGIVRHLLGALFTMIEHERKNMAPEQSVQTSTQNQTFKNFLNLLEQNFRRPEGVDFYADKLFMSGRNLNLICQNIMQKSVSEIIEIRKLTEAKNLLIHSDKNISEIGYELGYSEKAYFTNVFRKKSGQTPSEFREEMRKLIS
jgi:AraC-like DNA-binding protein